MKKDDSMRLHLALLRCAVTPGDELPVMRGQIMPCQARRYSNEAVARMLETVAAEGIKLSIERIGEQRLLCWAAPAFPPLMLLRALAHVTERVIGALEQLGYAGA